MGSVMGDDEDHHCVNRRATRRYSALKFRPRLHKVAVKCWDFYSVSKDVGLIG